MWEEEQIKERDSQQGYLLDYSFLRHLGGRYCQNRQGFGAEDRIDYINKMVAMIKTQIKKITYQESHQGQMQISPFSNIYSDEKLQQEIDCMRQKLQKSEMREKQLHSQIDRHLGSIAKLENQNCRLKQQMVCLKETKNSISQQLIGLSNKVYELQRFHSNGQHDISLEQYSAISDHEGESEQKQQISLFGRRNSKLVFNLYESVTILSEEDEEFRQLAEINMNQPDRVNLLRQSLPCHFKREDKDQNDYFKEVQKVKQKADRLLGLQNDRREKRSCYRKTLDPFTNNNPVKQNKAIDESRRFRRMR